MLHAYLICTAALSTVTLVLFAADKLLSKNERRSRIPEETLLCFTALGGSIGALLGIYLIRHKSNFKTKFHFAVGAWFSFAVQSAVAVLAALYAGGYINGGI